MLILALLLLIALSLPRCCHFITLCYAMPATLSLRHVADAAAMLRHCRYATCHYCFATLAFTLISLYFFQMIRHYFRRTPLRRCRRFRVSRRDTYRRHRDTDRFIEDTPAYIEYAAAITIDWLTRDKMLRLLRLRCAAPAATPHTPLLMRHFIYATPLPLLFSH